LRPAFRNVAYNLAGQILPMAIAIVSLPMLARHAGTERLGFLGLAWALIGYFALLDLGLSRIVTRRVALADQRGTMAAENDVVRKLCVRLFVPVAIVSALLAIVVEPRWIVGASASPALLAEARRSLPVLFLTIPATVVTGLMRGALEGMQRFAKANLLRSIFGALTYAAPLAVLPFRNDLFALTLSITVVRFMSLVAHGWWALQALALQARAQPAASTSPTEAAAPGLAAMIREGGWLTVSNVVGPLMVTFDRFAVAAIVSLTAASYYFVPQEVALRLLVVPGAVATTIFPMLARLPDGSVDRHRISRDALLAIAVASLPPCAALAGLAPLLLSVWMGAQFAASAAPVAAIITVGLFANCCAQAPFAWIQAAGRADVTGRLHLIQLPFYAVILVTLTWRFGVIGAASAWSIRALADFGMLFVASSRLFPTVQLRRVLGTIALGTTMLAALACAGFIADRGSHIAAAGVLLLACLVLSLTMALELLTHVRR
jgi:O-antigen/teichoic acid export membrane protein